MSASRRPILSLTMRIAMSRESVRYCAVLAPVMALLLWTLPLAGQSGAKTDEWRSYGGGGADKADSVPHSVKAHKFQKPPGRLRVQNDNPRPRPWVKLERTPPIGPC